MINWLQISDLHYTDEKDARTSNFERLFLNFCKKNIDIDFVIATGDFRYYETKDYQYAKEFLQKIMIKLNLKIERDLFIVPGNHDINKNRQINAKEIANDCALLNTNTVNNLLGDFSLYKQFAEEILPTVYKNDDPTRVHVRTWHNKINILHLNTCLISDGNRNHNEVFDINTVCSDAIYEKLDNDCPTLIIGHHSLSDIQVDILNQFIQFVNRVGKVAAYLAGDKHIPNMFESNYLLDMKFNTYSIPNIVTGKLIPSFSDNYSTIEFIKHCWNEIDVVEQQHYEWNSNGSGREFTFHSGDIARKYTMRPKSLNNTFKFDKENLFQYNSGTTEYIGRNSNIVALQDFLDVDFQYPVVWWVITGLGGSGKSRIMYEVGISNISRWEVELIQDEKEIAINNLNELLRRSLKNLLLIIDVNVNNLGEIASWMRKCNNRIDKFSYPKVRVIFLRREAGDFESIPPQWVNSMLIKDSYCTNYLYKQSFLHLDNLCEEDIIRIIKSYLNNVYPNCKYEEKDLRLLAQTQKEINLLNRPLFSMFLADAYANGQTPFNWDEERVLQYTYKREKQIIIEKYEQAFKINPMDFPKAFECIENLYAAATINGRARTLDELIIEKNSFFREMEKATNLDETQIVQRMQTYGILQNKKIAVIEPDIVGEYFVLQRYSSLEMVYTEIDFYTKFFRDLYRILNSTYADIVTEILTYDTGGILEITYAMGLFELTAENVPLEIGVEAMDYLQMHVPDAPLALGAAVMGKYLAYGLSNIILKQKPEEAIPALLTLERLYKNNQHYLFAEAYVNGLINANEGQWYPFVLSELSRIYRLNFINAENESINKMIEAYISDLLSKETSYIKEQIEEVLWHEPPIEN